MPINTLGRIFSCDVVNNSDGEGERGEMGEEKREGARQEM